MPLPASGPISMSMINTELGRSINTANSRFSVGSVPATPSVFWLGGQSGSLNQTAPHAMSEFYSFNAECLPNSFLLFKNDTAGIRDFFINMFSDTCFTGLSYGSVPPGFNPGYEEVFTNRRFREGTRAFSWSSAQNYNVTVEGSTNSGVSYTTLTTFTVNNNTVNSSVTLPRSSGYYLRFRITS